MKIAILGAGFTGLTAAFRLLQKGHQVTLFEKDAQAGGLAGGFKLPGWEWTLEKSYHHWFTNDQSALNLAREIGHKIIIERPKTDIFIQGQISTLDSPISLIFFPYLPLLSRLRMGLGLACLKLIPYHFLEGKPALPWIRQFMGKYSAEKIWEPLFTGKFGNFKEEVALTWFWARIKKRTPSLAYPEGGFQTFADSLADKIEKLGGKILLNSEVTPSHFLLLSSQFNKIIVTLPSPIFTHIAPTLPSDYVKKISSIPHLSALNLILVLKKPFLKESYWLNITDKSFPFLVLAEHTNFMSAKHYGQQHILYIGNYLPQDHPYFKMSAQELFQVYKPFLNQINPSSPLSPLSPLSLHLFSSPFAQPVVTTNYPKLIPTFQTPLKNIFLANLDMVYPWDRGTNYAIEMGEKVAKEIAID